MSHERDVPFHLVPSFRQLVWASSIGILALAVIAWLLPSQYSATVLIVVLAAGAAAATALGCIALGRRRGPPTERDLVQILGSPLLAVRPLREAALRGLCRQLLDHWLHSGRVLLPVVSAQRGEGRTYLAAQLASAFAALGEKTLLIDGDFRSPALHAAFGVPNEGGLADYLAGKATNPVPVNENLALLVAGDGARRPLELLGGERLRTLVTAAAKHFRVIVVDTPAAARGPDLEIFAALATGALVVASQGSSRPLARLRTALGRCAAQPLAIVVNQRQSLA